MINRREFLNSLVAAGVVAAVPKSIMAAAEAINDAAEFGWADTGDGWFRIWKTVPATGKDGYSFKLSFGGGAMEVRQGTPGRLLTNMTEYHDPDGTITWKPHNLVTKTAWSDQDEGEEGIERGSVNLLLNGSFEDDAGWTQEVRDGDVPSFTALNPSIEFEGDREVEAYTFSCYVRGVEVEKALEMIVLEG